MKLSRRKFLTVSSLAAVATAFPTPTVFGASAVETASTDVLTRTADIRRMIVGLASKVELADGSKIPAINFDNAATTPSMLPVMEEVNKQLTFTVPSDAEKVKNPRTPRKFMKKVVSLYWIL